MMLSRRLATGLAIAAVVVAAGGCDRKAKKGLPAATDWQSPALGSAPTGPGPTVGRAGAADPHAGIPGAPPIGGGGAADPHAGVPGAPPLTDEQIAGGSMPGADPHAGVPGAPPLGDDLATDGPGAGGGLAVEQLGLPAPDRDKPIDASKFLAGTVTAPPANQAKIPTGAAIFLSVRAADAAGAPTGMPIAVDKLVTTGTWPLAFRITEAQAMVGGTAFSGAVVISARYDQDGEAMSKQPGDISGTVAAAIPSQGLAITLDSVLP